MTFAQCTDCPGTVIVGRYSTITVPRVDEEGFPQLGSDGTLRYITLRLPNHRARFVSSSGPDVPHSTFDPTGLAPAECQHGIPEHPDGVRLRYGGQSWIRSKYLDVGRGIGVTCPVCRGEEAPEDLTTPRVA